jgi:dihydroneopterin aldolase
MSPERPALTGLVPAEMQVRSTRIVLDSLDVAVDIGFHEFEIGTPQRLLVTVECWLDDVSAPVADDPANAWNYDYLRSVVVEIAASRRFNLQETLAHEVFARIAPLQGLRALRVRTSKPDIYADALGVGVEIASFRGAWPSV